MTMPQFDPLAFLTARRKERERRMRESDAEHMDEIERLRITEIADYAEQVQKPDGDKT